MPTLHWLTREADLGAADRTPYRLLEEVAGLGHGDPAAANMLIQGDNLEALKALLPFYAGQVKCIYIDPPYNTRSAFEHYDDNLEHTQWLAMMWPRLELLRELLSEDGSIWVSIDDHEGHYLKVMMDEVFGRGNFVANFVWEKDKGGRGDADISLSHDHVLLFAQNKNEWSKVRNLIERTAVQKGRFRNPDNDPRGAWRQGDDGTAKSGTDKQRFPITLPSGRTVVPKPGRFWAFSEETFKVARKEGRAYFGKNGDRLPLIKRYQDIVREGVAPRTWLSADEVGTNQSAKRDHLNKLLRDVEPFATPKPETLLSRMLHISTNPGDLVLDSFLGSGTTAAVALKMGRRVIGIEMGEHAVTHCAPRLAKVVDGEQGGISKAQAWAGGSGFRFWRLGPPVFDAEGRLSAGIAFPVLAAHVWFSETGSALPCEGAGRLRMDAPLPLADGGGAGVGVAALTVQQEAREAPPEFVHERRGSTPIPRPSPIEGEGSSYDERRPGPVLGVHEGRALALLYNGVLGDKRPAGGNVLTRPVLALLRAALPAHDGPWTVYGERSTLSPAVLAREGVAFRQTPYDVKARR